MGDTTDMATARGRLSLPPLLRLLLSPDMDTATDTATDTVTGTATATDTADMAAMATMDTDTARGRLSLPPLLRLMPMPTTDTAATATDTAMDTVMDTDMATDTAVATA